MTDNVFNLDDAVETDETPPFQFVFGGVQFGCATPDQLDLRDLHDFAERVQTDPAVQLRWMLGEEQWDRLDKIDAVFSRKHMEALTDGWLKHHGLDLPKSDGSPKSSRAIRMR